ncbi:MAG: putative LPS assembly protein LptD [Ilyomonas sp.]
MSKRCKVNRNYFSFGLGTILLLFITFHINAKGKHGKYFLKSLTETSDTTLPSKHNSAAKDTSIKKDSSLKSADTIIHTVNDSLRLNDSTLTDTTTPEKIDTLLFSKDSLDAPIEYAAEDSGVLIIPSKEFYLYGKANTKNKDVDLTANTIRYNQETHMVIAYGGIDTANNPLSKPTITQEGSTSISDTIFFNIKTQKGLTKNTYYNEGELFINAQKVKKVSKDVAFAYRGRFTTCNLDTPHFDIRARKLKIINNKIAVSGPAFPEFEGVPMPIGIPFGIYPLTRGRHSGLLPPQFSTNDQFGLGLEGLGYYKVLSDYWDVTVRGNIYSYGGWNLNINPRYFKRYKYSGNLSLEIQNTKILNATGLSKEEFTTTKGYFITWSHSQDTKARPGVTFSASVRAGSTKFNQYIPNNALRNYENQLTSSITYSKTWGQGKYNLSLSANHDQNNNLGLINVRVPTVNFTANTIYPLQKKEVIGTPKWYEKLGISYTGTLLNQFSFYDSAFSLRRLLDTAQWGAQHNIPISLSLPPLGPLIVAPSVSYSERWFGQEIIRKWDDDLNKVDTTIHRGFYTAREMSFGISLNTRIFGTVNFPKSNGIKAIRHEVKPYVSISYKPDLVKQYFDKVQIDSAGHTYTLSRLDGGVLGSFSQGRFGGMSFGIDNLFEMKVKNKTGDTTGDNATKKIRLIDGLSINSGYNFLADTMQWQPISMQFRSTLFEKINITGGASIDPYGTDSFGTRVNRLLWRQGQIGRFTNGNLAISTSLQSKSKDNKKPEDRITPDETLTPDEQMRQLEYVRENPSEFVDFDIPWTLQVSYSLNLYRAIRPDFKGFYNQISSSLNLNGDFSLSPKWKIGGATYFDFRQGRISTLTMFVTRDMHCWQLAINLTPVGLYKSFSIVLNPKSGILRDLKINRSRFFYSQ